MVYAQSRICLEEWDTKFFGMLRFKHLIPVRRLDQITINKKKENLL